MELFRTFIKLFELIALFSCIYSYAMLPNKNKKAILLVLSVVVFTDWGAYILKQNNAFGPFSKFWFILLVPLELILWANLFKANIKLQKWRNIINKTFIIYGVYVLIVALLNIYEIDVGIKINYFSYAYTVGVILLSFVCLFYLYQTTTSAEIMYIWKSQLFYICFALLIFYLGTLPFHALKITLNAKYPNLFLVYYNIFIILNYFLYTLISISLLWKKVK